MGMQLRYVRYIEKYANELISGVRGKNMLELGDQRLKGMKKITKLRSGKEYFLDKGVAEHVSIDLNGRRGALKIDLAKPITNPEWMGHFDIITNLGTTEHVEPQSGQFTCFQSLHNMLKVGGIVIHILPDIEERDKANFHCNHANNYYSSDFFKMLTCTGLAYDLVDLSKHKFNIYACLKKCSSMPFMDNRELFESFLIRREGGKVWKGINDRV